LQPAFFSIGFWHLGHDLVLAAIQVTFSDSDANLLFHFTAVSQSHGTWDSWLHNMQNYIPHLQSTVGWNTEYDYSKQYSQFFCGHHLIFEFNSV
jgi:hypothetical protein